MIALNVLLGVTAVFAVAYNRFVSQRNLLTETWRDIDVELQRRRARAPRTT